MVSLISKRRITQTKVCLRVGPWELLVCKSRRDLNLGEKPQYQANHSVTMV